MTIEIIYTPFQMLLIFEYPLFQMLLIFEYVLTCITSVEYFNK